MTDVLTIDATLEPRGSAGAFVLDDEVVAELGAGRKAFPVTVTVNGTRLALRLSRMGGENLIGLSKAARLEAGVELGTTYRIEVAVDGSERSVPVPDDLAAALEAEPKAAAAFAGLAPSHRKEYVRWIVEAKREATRSDRVAKTVERLRDGGGPRR